MRLARLGSIAAVIAAICALGGSLVAGGAMATTPARAQLTLFNCVHALDPANRAVSVQAVMRPLTGTKKLAVKFQLLERTPGAVAPQTVVRAGDLGVWVTPSNPTLGQLPGDVWRLNKTALNLDAPASYQFKVVFRWSGAHGKVLGTAVRQTPSCKQRELRPDLAVQSITVSPIADHPEKNLYTATIANLGATGAGPFEVLFTPGDSSAATTKTIQFLSSHQTRQLSFVGPACNLASPPTVTADAADQVDDYNRSNNELAATCPSSTSGPSPSSAGSSLRPRGS